jgi:hypothetical protein
MLGAQDLPPGVLLLSRVRRHVEAELKQLNNVSCLETVHREQQKPKGKMIPLDTVRLEVLTNGETEQYASPGGRKFSPQHPISYAGSGLLGTGLFGIYLKSVVVSGFTRNEYKGEEEIAGRRLARWDFTLGPNWSGERINLLAGSGTVGLHGSYWADPESFDVVRLELHADRIPASLPLMEVTTVIQYGRTRLSTGAEVLLPETAELLMVQSSGEIDHNRVEFTHCRVFGAESSLSFAEAEPAPHFGASTVDDTLRPLAADLEIAVKLRTPVTGDMAVGTLVEGVASKAAGIAEGSPVRGRIRRMERYSDPMPHYVVALEFTEVESEGIRYRFYADVKEIEAGGGVTRRLETAPATEIDGALYRTTKTTLTFVELPGVATFFVNGAKLELRPGFRTVWKTKALAP